MAVAVLAREVARAAQVVVVTAREGARARRAVQVVAVDLAIIMRPSWPR